VEEEVRALEHYPLWGWGLRKRPRPFKVQTCRPLRCQTRRYEGAAVELQTVTELNITNASRSRNRHAFPNRRNTIVALAGVAGLLALGLLTLGTLALSATAWAEPATDAEPPNSVEGIEERRVIPVTISKGETYTISGLEKGAKTESKAVSNPNSLTVQAQSSGDIVLLGTEGGSWRIDATLASGEKVTYDVKVRAQAPPINSLMPGSAPTAIGP